MKLLKRTFLAIIAGIFLFSLVQYKLVFYGISQLYGQLHIVWNVIPVDQVMNDPQTPIKIKEKLKLIDGIKKFAVDSLGLLPSENYSTYYNQHDKPVLWVLTGCKPFALEAKTWWFPLLGEVSYKGFFDKEKGDAALAELIHEGYDADLSPTGGWSTLGWFKDPVLSNMLKRSDGVLAELIIHELTHGTVYLKSSVDFNENLATFIGEQGAIYFLKTLYRNDSTVLENYLKYKADENLYGNYLLESQKQMDSLYHSFKDDVTLAEKTAAKTKLITTIVNGISNLELNFPERYVFNLQKNKLPNNTWFMSNNRYRKSQQQMETVFKEKFSGNTGLFIKWVKSTEQTEVIKVLGG